MKRPEPGIYLAHKPRGVTSFSIVQRYHQALSLMQGRSLAAMHGGTLDPFAEGLLLILVGQATKLFELLHAAPKTYVAEVRFGEETDNGDPTGKIIERADASGLTPKILKKALAPHLGWTEQVPPTTSAKKIGGEPAYKKVHRGEAVTLPPSRVYVHSARFVSHALPDRSCLEVVSRGGFYVRALARDLGRALGCRAHLTALQRTQIGPWTDPGPDAEPIRISGPDLLPWAQRWALTDHELGALRKGEAIPSGSLQRAPYYFPAGFPDANAPILGLHQGRLTALLDAKDDALRLRQEFPGGL